MTVNRSRDHVNDNSFGGFIERVKKDVSQSVTQADKFLAVHPVFELGHGRLGCQDGFGAESFTGRGLERRIELIAFGILIALANLQNALMDQVDQRIFGV